MNKHTPGPWIIRYAKNITAIGTPKGEMQLSLHGVYDGLKPLSVDLHEWKANAHLIAAAPAMYEALTHALSVCEAEAELRGENDIDDYLGGAAGPVARMIRAALAQAEARA